MRLLSVEGMDRIENSKLSIGKCIVQLNYCLSISSAECSCTFFKPTFAYRQTVWTLIRLLQEEQSHQGPHCLQKLLSKSQADDKADDKI